MKSIFIVGCTMLMGAPAFGGRSITVPPLTQETAAGGVLEAPGGASPPVYSSCVTADMTAASTYGIGGVQSMNQRYRISFQNLSSAVQTVTVNLLPGTNVAGRNSRANGNIVPDAANTPRQITASTPLTFSLPGNGNYIQEINFQTNDTKSAIQPIDGDIACTGVQQICLYQQSTLIVSISIAEDRGAVLANISSSAHRCAGFVDHYIQPPLGFQVNGGRPI